MICTLDNQRFKDLKLRFRQLGAGQKEELEETWHNSAWPIDSWNQIVANKYLFNDPKDSAQESMIKVFSALEGWTSGTGDSSFCTSLVVQYLLCHPIIKEFFPDYQIKDEEVVCFALTELAGGSSPFDMSVTMDTESNTVSGIKWHITNAPVCDHLLVFGKDSKTNQLAMAMVKRRQPGVKVEQLACEGMKNSPVGKIYLKGAQAGEIIVSTSKVKKAVKHAFQAERLGIGFVTSGVVEYHLEKLLHYLRSRKVGGNKIIRHQYLQKRLTDIKIQAETLKALIHCTIKSLVQGNDVSALASKIKILGIKQVVDFAEQGMKCFGSYGVQRSTGLMRLMSDSICASIAGGTEEIHRNVIFSKMLRENVNHKQHKELDKKIVVRKPAYVTR